MLIDQPEKDVSLWQNIAEPILDQKRSNDYFNFLGLVKEAAEKSMTKAEEQRKQSLMAFFERKQREQHLHEMSKLLKE